MREMYNAMQQELVTALSFYADIGVEDLVLDEVVDRFAVVEAPVIHDAPQQHASPSAAADARHAAAQPALLGASEAYEEAVRVAKSATTLEALRQAIADFDGIAIKKTASNLVFASGHANADIMVIGDAPAADEDRQGTPFVGQDGQLLDKILACIDLDRTSDDVKTAAYLTNMLNWRPPGNRSPTAAEIDVSTPFIEQHIQLVKPKLLILCGAIPAKTLLGRTEGISRLRKTIHSYSAQTDGLGAHKCDAIVTYHPSYLIQSPAQKRLVWADMLTVKNKINHF